MQWFAHLLHPRHQDEAPPKETRGFVLNWGLFYDLGAQFFVRLVFGGSEQALRQMTVDLAQIQAGETVLDVGCGTGTLALEAYKRVGAMGQVCGIDPAQKQIARARSKAARSGLPIEFQVGVIERLAFSDQSFDIVLSTFMMHHLPDDLKRQGIQEIARVLKPGGRLLVLDMKGPAGPWKSRIQDQPAFMEEAGLSKIETGDARFRGLGFVRARKNLTGEGNDLPS